MFCNLVCSFKSSKTKLHEEMRCDWPQWSILVMHVYQPLLNEQTQLQ